MITIASYDFESTKGWSFKVMYVTVDHICYVVHVGTCWHINSSDKNMWKLLWYSLTSSSCCWSWSCSFLYCLPFVIPLLCLRVCWWGLESSSLLPPVRSMSSVNHRLHMGLPPIERDVWWSQSGFCMIFSRKKLNSMGERKHPWWTPTVVLGDRGRRFNLGSQTRFWIYAIRDGNWNNRSTQALKQDYTNTEKWTEKSGRRWRQQRKSGFRSITRT